VTQRRLILDDYVPYRLSVASNAVSRVISRAYATRFGLKIPEWRLVAVLADHGDLTQQELVARTEMDKVTVSRAVQGLVGRGLAAQHLDPADGRLRRLRLTDEGRGLHAEISPAALALEGEVLSGLSAEEVATLTALLRRVEAAANERLP
jgi:DNA-binding MarR family transcriptional regulator